jgi:tetratricopeptide (TPR) repeat protein
MQLAIETDIFVADVAELIQDANSAQDSDDLKRAEQLYLQVLNEDPLNPDANHNLGILYLSVNLSEKALPLLRTALEAHPEFEHFWLSYFHGLVYNRKFAEGRAILAAGKENGLSCNTLTRLEEVLFSALEEA